MRKIVELRVPVLEVRRLKVPHIPSNFAFRVGSFLAFLLLAPSGLARHSKPSEESEEERT